MIDRAFWKNKKVLVTGNTGFKGIWLCKFLLELNSKVIGYSDKDLNDSIKKENLKKNKNFIQFFGDINNKSLLQKIITENKPQIIFHLAAQSLVYKSYIDPVDTFNTNGIGTLNILEIVRKYKFVKAAIVVTSDKCYKPINNKKYFDENSILGGNDPYSASKAISEIIALSYIKSFSKFNIATVRAGNVNLEVIGVTKTFPRLMKLVYEKKKLKIRNLISVRPWQHVLEPLTGYLLLANRLFNDWGKKNSIFRSGWNFGPSINNHVNVKTFIKILEKNLDKKLTFDYEKKIFHEEESIFLNSNKSKKILKWKNFLTLENSIKISLEWYENFYQIKKENINTTEQQIKQYLKFLDTDKNI